jgi:hypothetical protein
MKHTALAVSSLVFLAQAGFSQSNPGWVTVIDPREQAFSIEIPQGWKAHGGMFRSNPVDARPFVDINSPDGKTNIRVGDASVPSYDLPNPVLQSRQPAKFVAPYATGDAFATKYGQDRFRSLCQNLQIYKTATAEPVWGRGSGGIRITAGWAGFTCTENGAPMGAYVYAETMEIMPTFGSAGHWYVITLGSAIAPIAQGKAAGDILLHCYKSIALNPAWMRNQGQIVSAARQGVLHSAAEAQKIYDQASQNFQKNMKMQASEVDNFNDVLLGQTYTRDASGQTYAVPSGNGGTLWRDPMGAVKESAMVPGPGFTQLTPISR